jgi:hypothetical protein
MGFGRGRHVEEDTTSHLQIVSRLQNVDAQRKANTNDMPFREPNINAA